MSLTPEEAREHPACVGWIYGGGKPPACAAPDQLAGLKGSFSAKLVVAQDSLPQNAAQNATAVKALIGASAVYPSEILLSARITNAGRTDVPLSGVTITLAFSGRVKVPTFDRWVDASPDEFVTSCWWGQVSARARNRPAHSAFCGPAAPGVVLYYR